jgi:hypothetical protein
MTHPSAEWSNQDLGWIELKVSLNRKIQFGSSGLSVRAVLTGAHGGIAVKLTDNVL